MLILCKHPHGSSQTSLGPGTRGAHTHMQIKHPSTLKNKVKKKSSITGITEEVMSLRGSEGRRGRSWSWERRGRHEINTVLVYEILKTKTTGSCFLNKKEKREEGAKQFQV